MPSVDGPRIAAERLTRLGLGTKSGPLLPAGLAERFEPINVMEFIRAAEEITDFEGSYALFCDVSHPSYMHSERDSLTIYAECQPDTQREIDQHRDKRSGHTHT